MDGKKILWLVSWYPNEADAFDGDFIQRHAQAAAVYNHIHVLFVKPIPQTEVVRETIVQNGSLTEQLVYIKKEHGVLKKLHQQWRWFHQHKKAVERYIHENGLPDLVHVHVPWKAGLVALWIKQNYNVPYIVTEHWGIYNEVVTDRFSARPFWMQHLFKRIYSQAAAVASVSRFLVIAIKRHMGFRKSFVIPNVVDTSLFFYRDVLPERFTLLHVSNMVSLKNVEGILDAFALFQNAQSNVQLILIGNKDNTYVRYAEELGIKAENISFRGEVPYTEVAKAMQEAHCLVVNSVIENSPCVIGEALCCGLPVITTNVGGIPELVDASNSILIPSNNNKALLAAFQKAYGDFKKFDRRKMAAAAAVKFGSETIASIFNELYAAVAADR